MKREFKIAVLPGDGIGPVVVEAALQVLEAMDLELKFNFGRIGWQYWCEQGNPLPAETEALVAESDAVLFGAITSKPEKEAAAELSAHLKQNGCRYSSPIVELRRKFQLFCAVRPVKDLLSEDNKLDLIICRENCEDLYLGYDYQPPPKILYDFIWQGGSDGRIKGLKREETAVSLKIYTLAGIKRFLEKSFTIAKKKKRKKVTLIHKANIMRATDGLFLKTAEEMAEKYPDLEFEAMNVDTAAMKLVSEPQRFEMLICPNLYGDILSDLAAGLAGSIGLAPSANFGTTTALFEPVHGSAPDLPPDSADPVGAILSAAMMLEWLELEREAQEIETAVRKTLTEGRILTPDLGGTSRTSEMVKAIIDNLNGI